MELTKNIITGKNLTCYPSEPSWKEERWLTPVEVHGQIFTTLNRIVKIYYMEHHSEGKKADKKQTKIPNLGKHINPAKGHHYQH